MLCVESDSQIASGQLMVSVVTFLTAGAHLLTCTPHTALNANMLQIWSTPGPHRVYWLEPLSKLCPCGTVNCPSMIQTGTVNQPVASHENQHKTVAVWVSS